MEPEISTAKDHRPLLLLIDDQVRGPFDYDQLRDMWLAGTVTRKTVCREEGSRDWVPLGSYTACFAARSGHPNSDMRGSVSAQHEARIKTTKLSESNSSKAIYLDLDNQQEGPFEAEQLQAMVASGSINLQTMARLEGTSEWASLCNFLDFCELEAISPDQQPSPDSTETHDTSPTSPSPFLAAVAYGLFACILFAALVCLDDARAGLLIKAPVALLAFVFFGLSVKKSLAWHRPRADKDPSGPNPRNSTRGVQSLLQPVQQPNEKSETVRKALRRPRGKTIKPSALLGCLGLIVIIIAIGSNPPLPEEIAKECGNRDGYAAGRKGWENGYTDQQIASIREEGLGSQLTSRKLSDADKAKFKATYIYQFDYSYQTGRSDAFKERLKIMDQAVEMVKKDHEFSQ